MQTFFISIGGVLIGLIFSFMMIKSSSSFFPNDFSRTNTILHALKEQKPTVVLFGNSVLMNGVDANKFRENTLNLGSSGQGLTESILYYQQIPESVDRVVQFIDAVALLDSSRLGLREGMALNFISEGYFINDFTEKYIDNASLYVFNSTTMADLSRFKRRQFQGGLNSFFREVFQKDILFNEKWTNVKNPFIYTKQLEEEKVKELIDIQQPENRIDEWKPNVNLLHSLKELTMYFKERGVSYSIVISPIHPNMKHYSEEFHHDLSRVVKENPGIAFYNFSQLLNSDEFVDHAHPNADGREKITRKLIKAIE